MSTSDDTATQDLQAAYRKQAKPSSIVSRVAAIERTVSALADALLHADDLLTGEGGAGFRTRILKAIPPELYEQMQLDLGWEDSDGT